MAPKDAWIGATVGDRYRVLDKLGDGGMGSVYRALQLSVDRVVAIKFLHPHMMENRDALKRFEREARTCSKLRHSNAIHLYDYGTEAQYAYLVMEYIEGQSLRALLDGADGVSLPRFADLVRQICDALAEAHHLGIVHRDLKPANIMLTAPRAGRVEVKVVDFGIAKIVDAGESSTVMTQTGMIIGTPQYMSPEQAEGASTIDHRSDIYSLGIIMYEMLTGEAPFTAETPLQLLMKHVKDRPVPPREFRPGLDIPPGLEAVVMKALEKRPEDRYSSVEALQAELLEAVGAAPPGDRGAAFEAALTTLHLSPTHGTGGPDRPLIAETEVAETEPRNRDIVETEVAGDPDLGVTEGRASGGGKGRPGRWIGAALLVVAVAAVAVWWLNRPTLGYLEIHFPAGAKLEIRDGEGRAVPTEIAYIDSETGRPATAQLSTAGGIGARVANFDLDPGGYRIITRRDGYRPDTSEAVIHAGERARVDVTLRPLPEPAAGQSAFVPDDVMQQARRITDAMGAAGNGAPGVTRVFTESARQVLVNTHDLELVWFTEADRSRNLSGSVTIRDERGLLRVSGTAGPGNGTGLSLEGYLERVEARTMTFQGTIRVAVPDRPVCERRGRFEFTIPPQDRRWALERESPCDGIDEYIYIRLK